MSDVAPVMLYNVPHPVHRRMAEAIDAELVPADQGGVVDHVRSAMARRFDDPVILEGGVPLFEGSFLKVLRRVTAPVILLAADETQHNVRRPLPYYSTSERLVHRVAHRFVDGVIAVSETVADDARALVDGPVEVAEPFVLEARAESLGEAEPDLDSNRVLCVGEYRPANNQDALVRAAAKADAEIRVDLVGKGTKNAADGPHVRRHGYISEERLLELFERASLFCLPARAGAFPVATLEALQAGLPVMVSDRVGTQRLAAELNPRFVTQAWDEALAVNLDWYFATDTAQRREWSEKARQLGSVYNEADGIGRFVETYDRLVEELP